MSALSWINPLFFFSIFFIFVPIFSRFHEIPKNLIFAFFVVLVTIQLALKSRISLPGKTTVYLFFGLILASVISFLQSTLPLVSLWWGAYFSGGFLILMWFYNEDIIKSQKWKVSFYLLILVELVFSLFQFGSNQWAAGTLGSREFLALLMGVGFFLPDLFREENLRIKSLVKVASFAGLLLAGNKGGVLFICLWQTWQILKVYPRTKWLIAPGILGSLFALSFSVSLKSRIFIWLVSVNIFLENIWGGVGLGHYHLYYIAGIKSLFGQFEWARSIFGTYSGNVLNAHNLPLQMMVEMGVLGALFSVVLYYLVFKNFSRLSVAEKGLVGFILYKSLYTVTITSAPVFILIMLIAGVLLKKYSSDPLYLRPLHFSPALVVGLLLTFITAQMAAGDYYYHQSRQFLRVENYPKALESLKLAKEYDPENGDYSMGEAYIYHLRTDSNKMDHSISKTQ